MNDFTTSLLKRIDGYNSLDKKIEYHKNMANGIIKNFNDIVNDFGVKIFEFALNDFKKSNRLNLPNNMYVYTLEFYYNDHITEFIYIEVDIFNENNYDIIFNKMFDVLLHYSDISDMITSVDLNKNNGNMFTNYLKKNLK